MLHVHVHSTLYMYCNLSLCSVHVHVHVYVAGICTPYVIQERPIVKCHLFMNECAINCSSLHLALYSGVSEWDMCTCVTCWHVHMCTCIYIHVYMYRCNLYRPTPSYNTYACIPRPLQALYCVGYLNMHIHMYAMHVHVDCSS